jgi:hypothetical protein
LCRRKEGRKEGRRKLSLHIILGTVESFGGTEANKLLTVCYWLGIQTGSLFSIAAAFTVTS